MYHSWDIKHDRQFFCHSGSFFALCPMNPENQNFGKMRKPPGDIIILHMCTVIDNHMMYGTWDIKCDIICHFGPFFALLPPEQPKKSKFNKNNKKKIPGDITILK